MDLLALGKEPISPDQPAGSDVRYDPEFDLLQAEIDKLSSPSATAGTDWKKVQDISIKILSEKSKDMLVACYLAVSLIHTRQIDGLADGLVVLRDMTREFWEIMFPPKKRMRGRLGAIEFWLEKSETVLESMKTAPVTDRWEEIKGTLAELDAIFKDLLPEPPLLTPIERQVNRLGESPASPQQPLPKKESKDTPGARSASENAAPKATAVSKPENRKADVVKPVEASEKEVSEVDPKKIIQKGFQQFRQAAALIFEENPADASAYRYRRIEAWAKVSVLPPANGDKTQIPPPPPHEFQNISDLRANRSWNFLLRAAEHKISQYIFWFDLNRFVAEALINMGEAYIRAHKVVCDETAFLLHRLKGLDRLAFSDGTPFADPETRKWIASISLAGSAAPMDQMPVIGSGQDTGMAERMSATINKARDLLKKMKPMEAVNVVYSELQHCGSQKESLLWRMALCRIILGSDKKSMVLPHLELMLDAIDDYRLESWDPELAINALKTLWAGYSAFNENQYQQKAAEILSRIAKINPVEAMRMGD